MLSIGLDATANTITQFTWTQLAKIRVLNFYCQGWYAMILSMPVVLRQNYFARIWRIQGINDVYDLYSSNA